MATTPNYTVDYEDERFAEIEDAQAQKMADEGQVYDNMINSTDKFYQDQIGAVQQWGDKQAQLQQDRTDFVIEQQNQLKDQANKDYIKEQKGAYVDWQKQSNPYGANAEKMAAAGLTGSGYAESSQVSMYNQYQNRVATAREVYNRAVLNYDNAIKDAQLQNNAALAEIAFNTLQQTLTLSLQGFQYKNDLILQKSDKLLQIDEMYYNRWQNVLQQINTENAMAENVRQFNEGQKFQAEQAELDRQFNLKRDELNRQFEAKQAELDRTFEEAMLKAKNTAEENLAKNNHARALEILAEEHANNLEILKKEYEYTTAKKTASGGSAKITGGSSGSKSSGSKKSSSGSKSKSSSSSSKITNTSSKKTTSSKTSSKSNPTVDMNSVLALGYGPISTSRLNQLVEQGVVKEYVEGNKIKFKKALKTVGIK